MKFLKFSFLLLILTATSPSWAQMTDAEKRNSEFVRKSLKSAERKDAPKAHQEMMKPTDGKRGVNPSTGGKVTAK
jgi:hypothetical protein